MKLLDLFKKRDDTDTAKKAADIKELEIYSGMRVAVETPEGQILFIADLQDPCKRTARLCQCSDGESVSEEEPVSVTDRRYVKLRGYNNHERKAVFMEGFITQEQRHVWQIKELKVIRVENERTFSRLDTDIDALMAPPEGGAAEDRPCKVLNISVGGASISSEYPYDKGDRFLLKVKLSKTEQKTLLYCEVLRVTEKSPSSFEYGCQFLELAAADQKHLAQSISELSSAPF